MGKALKIKISRKEIFRSFCGKRLLLESLPELLMHYTFCFICQKRKQFFHKNALSTWQCLNLLVSPSMLVLPAGINDGSVSPRADVFQNERVLITGGVQMCVVGFANSKEVRCWVTCWQLDDVSYQSSGTETEHMNPCKKTKNKRMIKYISTMMLQSNWMTIYPIFFASNKAVLLSATECYLTHIKCNLPTNLMARRM